MAATDVVEESFGGGLEAFKASRPTSGSAN